jgi:putative Mg2+ transporter-C (MgtC) family protein
MQTVLDWEDLVLRLAMTVAAGAAIGLNRGEHGKPAGLRTTILVCLAASVAMLLANLLLGTAGKAPDSFVQLDVMRLPLGILTGMGFIGGGAILRRDNLIVGVTTAATLWLVTVIGLCIGAGEIALGWAATGLGLLVLWGLGIAEQHLPQVQRARLVVVCADDAAIRTKLPARLRDAGFAVAARGAAFMDEGRRCETTYELRWRGASAGSEPPDILAELAREAGVTSLRWSPIAR